MIRNTLINIHKNDSPYVKENAINTVMSLHPVRLAQVNQDNIQKSQQQATSNRLLERFKKKNLAIINDKKTVSNMFKFLDRDVYNFHRRALLIRFKRLKHKVISSNLTPHQKTAALLNPLKNKPTFQSHIINGKEVYKTDLFAQGGFKKGHQTTHPSLIQLSQKFNFRQNKSLLNYKSLLAEISIHQYINQKNDTLAVQHVAHTTIKNDSFLKVYTFDHKMTPLSQLQFSSLKAQNKQNIVNQLTSKLEKLHAIGIVHRDIKEENIFIDENENVKFSDFGFSSLFKNNKVHGRSPATKCGTLDYISPIVFTFNGTDTVSKSCLENVDKWALGVMLWRLESDQYPYQIENITEFNPYLLKSHTNPTLLTAKKLMCASMGITPQFFQDIKNNLLKLCDVHADQFKHLFESPDIYIQKIDFIKDDPQLFEIIDTTYNEYDCNREKFIVTCIKKYLKGSDAFKCLLKNSNQLSLLSKKMAIDIYIQALKANGIKNHKLNPSKFKLTLNIN